MPFIKDILEHSSISIIGMEKNCGKTVVLNYILSRLKDLGVSPAVTSIGVDGERMDIVCGTAKPEITLYKGALFATAASLYLTRRVTSEIVALSDISTSLGDVVIAKVLNKGKVMLGGASSTPQLTKLIEQFKVLGSPLVLVDGALSRRSLASPAVTDATILCVGAAVSLSIDTLIAKSKHTFNMMNLPLYEGELKDGDIEVSGMLTDSMLKKFEENISPTIVVQDFTRIFVTKECYRWFTSRGGAIKVRLQSRVVAICFNPLSPNGYMLDSDTVCSRLESELGVKVFDVMRIKW